MSLIPCPECGKQVSDKAPACPNCAYPVREHLAKGLSASQPATPDLPAKPTDPIPPPDKPKARPVQLPWDKLVKYAVYAAIVGLLLWWIQSGINKQKTREHFRQNYTTAMDILNEIGSRRLNEEDKSRILKAVSLLEEAQAHDPLDPDIPYVLGNAHQRLRNWDEALAAYEAALRLKPNFPEAFHGIGNVYAAIALPEKAIEAYQNEIRLRPDKPESYARLGNVYYDNQRWNEAIEAYTKFTELAPRNAMGYVSLGQALYKAGRKAEAARTFEQGLRLDPLNTQTIYDLGLTYIAIGDRQSAANMLEMLRALHSEEYAAKLAKALGE